MTNGVYKWARARVHPDDVQIQIVFQKYKIIANLKLAMIRVTIKLSHGRTITWFRPLWSSQFPPRKLV